MRYRRRARSHAAEIGLRHPAPCQPIYILIRPWYRISLGATHPEALGARRRAGITFRLSCSAVGCCYAFNGTNDKKTTTAIAPGPESETVPSKRKSQSISDKDNDYDHATTLLDTDDDDGIPVAKCPEAIREAVRARMNVNQLEHSDMKCTLFVTLVGKLLRVDLHKHVIRMWYRNPCTRLVVERLYLKDVRPEGRRSGGTRKS